MDVLQILIHLVKKPNARNPLGWTPIQDAAKKGNTDILESLVAFTKNPNKPTMFNWTPIQLAILGGHVEAFKVLLDLTFSISTNMYFFP